MPYLGILILDENCMFCSVDEYWNQAIWSVMLDPVSYAGPNTSYTITASILDETIKIRDVLFGDVWICSGQSNMGYTVYMVRIYFVMYGLQQKLFPDMIIIFSKQMQLLNL